MKTAILSLGLSLSFLAPTVFAGEAIDYTAKLNEDGKFCAKVKIDRIGFGTVERVKCRTLEGWENAGYKISMPVELEDMHEPQPRDEKEAIA